VTSFTPPHEANLNLPVCVYDKALSDLPMVRHKPVHSGVAIIVALTAECRWISRLSFLDSGPHCPLNFNLIGCITEQLH
jgi:hypothetical protein